MSTWIMQIGAAAHENLISAEIDKRAKPILQERLEGVIGEPFHISLSEENTLPWDQVQDENHLLEYALTAVAFRNVATFKKIVDVLDIRNPKAINKRFKSGATLPFLLVENGKVKPQMPVGQMFDTVLNLKQFDPNQKTSGDGLTFLGMFAYTGNEYYCRRMLGRPGTDVNAQDNDGYTPFHATIVNGHLNIMKLLHEKKADINIPAHDGRGPLLTSLFFRVDDNGKVGNYPDTIPMELVAWGANLNAATQRGITPITLALMNRTRWSLADFFLNQKKSDPLYVVPEWNINYAHCLALFPTVSKTTHDLTSQEMPVVKQLIEKIAKKDTNLLLMRSKFGNNPLHDAASWGSTSNNLVKVFLQAAKQLGVPNYVNSQTDAGRTILHTAAAWGNTDLISFLLKNGANTTLKDNDGKMARDIAFASGEAKAIELLSTAVAGPKKNTGPASKKAAKNKKRHKKQKEAEKEKEGESEEEEEEEGLSAQLESCSLQGVAASGSPCSSSSDQLPESASTSGKQTLSQKRQANKIALDALVNLNLMASPKGVRAMRQRGENGGILIGYLNPEAREAAMHPSIEPGRYKCNQQKAGNILDKYHSFNREWDKYILGDGIKVAYEDRSTYHNVLDKYCLNAAPGYTFHILPGRIEDPAYDVRRALVDQEMVSPFKGHHGAFVIITNNEGLIIHRMFHPSQEQSAARRAFGW